MIKALIALLALAACLGFIQFQRKAIVITHYDIESPLVPETFDGVRILQVSDIQSEYFGRDQSNLLTKAAACEPDYVFITGDLIDRNHTNVNASLAAAKGLSKLAPTYYINGNHEMKVDDEYELQLYDGLEKIGVNKLFDRGVLLQRGEEVVSLCGLGEWVIYDSKEEYHENHTETDTTAIREKAQELAKAPWIEDAGLSAERIFKILITHEPQYVSVYDDPGFDLVFAGHAHGGQVRLPFIGGLFSPGQGIFPKYTAGIYQEKWSRLVVSRGLGNSTCPIRLFNRPELVVVHLKKNKGESCQLY